MGWETQTANAIVPAGAPAALDRDSTWRDTVLVHSAAVTQPWWLVKPRTGDLFAVPVSRTPEDERLDGASTLITATTSAGAAASVGLRIWAPVIERIGDPRRGEVDRPLAFVPAVSLTLDRTVEYAPAGSPIDRTMQVLLRSGADSAREVTVSLELPQGLVADSAGRRVTVPAHGSKRVSFRVTGALPPGEASIRVVAQSNGATFTDGYIPIEYDHIRPQKLYRPAVLTLSVADIKIPPGMTVAYIPGVGDNVEPMLEQLGLHVTVLDPASLPSTDLSRFTTVVVGPRAYEASADLVTNNGRLLDFARGGGTLVVQYGQFEMSGSALMPYPITLGQADRVTDENAPVRVLDPASPLLTTPNKVTNSDFAGWVQERSLYMPHTFDSHYHSLLAMNDPDEPSNDGAILVAPRGQRNVRVHDALVLPAASRWLAGCGAAVRQSARGGTPVLRRHVRGGRGWACALALLIAAGCSHDHRTVVLVYSPHGKELLQDFANRFMRVHPGIDLQWDDMGSTEVLDRVRAERDNPQANVWFGAPAELFERAAHEGLLEPYTPTWADAVPAEAHDSSGYWYGTYLTPEVIGYNSDVVTAAEAPRDWDDVLDPEVEREAGHSRPRRIGRDAGDLRRNSRAIGRRHRLDGGRMELASAPRRQHQGIHPQSDDPVPEARAAGGGDHPLRHARPRDAAAARAYPGELRLSGERDATAGGCHCHHQGDASPRLRARVLRVRDEPATAAGRGP